MLYNRVLQVSTKYKEFWLHQATEKCDITAGIMAGYL